MAKEFPTVPMSDIKKILQAGWKSLYLINSYGGDVLITRGNFWFLSGRLFIDGLKFYNYYR